MSGIIRTRECHQQFTDLKKHITFIYDKVTEMVIIRKTCDNPTCKSSYHRLNLSPKIARMCGFSEKEFFESFVEWPHKCAEELLDDMV